MGDLIISCDYSKTCLNRTPLGLKSFFSLDRFKVDGTVKSVWFRPVFGLGRFLVYPGFGLDRFLV